LFFKLPLHGNVESESHLFHTTVTYYVIFNKEIHASSICFQTRSKVHKQHTFKCKEI
jgi:hypothetical protein